MTVENTNSHSLNLLHPIKKKKDWPESAHLRDHPKKPTSHIGEIYLIISSNISPL